MNISNMFIGAPAQNPNGWQLLGQTDLIAGAATTMTLSGIPARKRLRIIVFCGGKSGADTLGVQFNGDGGANYYYQTRVDGAAGANVNGQTQGLFSAYSNTAANYAVFEVFNISGKGKRCFGHSHDSANITTNGPHCTDFDVFWNSNDVISSVTIKTTGGIQTMGTTSEMWVDGSD